jgi:tyrosyl-tRNA synthetase
MKNVLAILRQRGIIEQISSEAIEQSLRSPQKIYCGYDPSADSLHLGNFVTLVVLGWFQRCGHTPVVVVGGATGMIGDPSGKSKERNLLSKQQLAINIKGVRKNIEDILSFEAGPKPEIYDNFDWYSSFSFLDYLRDVGKHFRLGTMLAKESVRSRLQSEEGISFTEFSYQTLQAYDFFHLFKTKDVRFQLGGSDQWGNITAGIDFVKRELGEEVFGITIPLMTRSDGKKFGKSEEGAIWLSSEKLSPYDFYQYLFRVPDQDVIRMLKFLTYLDLDEIEAIEKSMSESDYVPNTAQKILAREVTKIVHGEGGVKQAETITALAKPGYETELSLEVLEKLEKEIPTVRLKETDVCESHLVDVLVQAKVFASKGQARKMIEGGGLYLNNEKVSDSKLVIEKEALLQKKYLLVSVGKKKKYLLKVTV